MSDNFAESCKNNLTTQRGVLFVCMTPEQQETIRTALALIGSIITLGLVGAIYSIFRTY